MVEKQIIDSLLSRLRHGRVTVTYWDGQTKTYGTGEPAIAVRIKNRGAVWGLAYKASIAFAEGYARGDWETSEDDLPALIEVILLNRPTYGGFSWFKHLKRTDRNRKSRQQRQIDTHYSIDNANHYYPLMLGETMAYSCAVFETTKDSIDTAQRQKAELLRRKLQLADGQHVLDIGCGWGFFLIEAAKRFNITGLGVSLSQPQIDWARAWAKREGVDDRITFEHRNYQDLPAGRFDRIVSIGFYEHVGRGNADSYFKVLTDHLAEGGLSVLHSITRDRPGAIDSWIDRYIFPGGYLPTVSEVMAAIERNGFFPLDFEDLARHYALTLDRWRANCQRHRKAIEQDLAKAMPGLNGKEAYRMRDLWLAASAGGFRPNGEIGLGQFIFTKGKPADWPLTRRYLYS